MTDGVEVWLCKDNEYDDTANIKCIFDNVKCKQKDLKAHYHNFEEMDRANRSLNMVVHGLTEVATQAKSICEAANMINNQLVDTLPEWDTNDGPLPQF